MYPKRIESLQTLNIVDETGLTGPEKVALRGAWRIIKPQQRCHANSIFFTFFTKYPQYFATFESPGEHKDNTVLHAHPLWILNSFGNLIEDGLRDVGRFTAALQSLIKLHKNLNLTKDDISCVTETVNTHLKKVLQTHMSPTLSKAIDTLCKQIFSSYG